MRPLRPSRYYKCVALVVALARSASVSNDTRGIIFNTTNSTIYSTSIITTIINAITIIFSSIRVNTNIIIITAIINNNRVIVNIRVNNIMIINNNNTIISNIRVNITIIISNTTDNITDITDIMISLKIHIIKIMEIC